jgi:hypothetical protein
MSQHEGTVHRPCTDDERVAWFARVWRQADKEAIADRSDEQKKRAEYWARSALRQTIDMAERNRTGQLRCRQ